jgi:branched-chain amino acid transport system substrate-binding protein
MFTHRLIYYPMRMLGLPALILALLLTACDSQSNASQSGAITIAGLYNISGAMSSLDLPAQNGALLAVKEINDNGGINGRQIRFVTRDGKTDPTAIQQITSDVLSQEHPAAVVGFTDSDSVLTSAPLVQKAGIPFITTGATSPRLPGTIGDMMFLACFGDNVQAAAGAEFMYNNLKARKIAIIYDKGTEYTRLLAGYFKDRWTQLASNSSVLAEDTYQFKDTDYSVQIARIQHLPTTPDALYIAAMPDDITTILTQLRAAHITLPVIGGDGYDTPDLLTIGNASDNVYYSTHALVGSPQSSAAIQQFSALYKTTYNTDADAFAVLGYDTIKLLADAIKRAGSTDPTAIKNALEQTTNFPGLSGSISYTPSSHVPSKDVTILAVSGDKLSLGAQVKPSIIPAP